MARLWQAVIVVGLIRRALAAFRARARDPAPPAHSTWEVKPAPGRIVAVGDLHGDVAAFGAILRASELVDERGAWSGGVAHLVLLGDLLGGHGDARLLLDTVLRLEREAAEAGGRVHAVLGNHDVLPIIGRFGKMSRSERARFTAHPVADAPGPELVDVFRGDSVYARWLRRRPAILKIGATVFVHAGLDRWAEEYDPDHINRLVAAWIAYYQGVGPRPSEKRRWLAGDDERGPLWMRSFKPRRDGGRRGGPRKKRLRKILSHLGATRVVVGHSPTPDSEIVLSHPVYGDAVVLVDTRISDEHRGRLGALIIAGDTLAPVYTVDREAGAVVRTRAHVALERRSRPSVWRRIARFFARLFRRRRRPSSTGERELPPPRDP